MSSILTLKACQSTFSLRSRTEQLIEELSPLYREIARMRLLDGMQYKEIADVTGLELNTVRTRIRRARMMLEQMKKKA